MQSDGLHAQLLHEEELSPLLPCGPTPVSVPNAIFTPASTAIRICVWSAHGTRFVGA